MKRSLYIGGLALLIFGGGQSLYIKGKAWLAGELLQTAWQMQQQGHGRLPPWPWADTYPLARIHFPRLGKDMMILQGNSDRNLAFGPVVHDGGVMPGENGQLLISGHRDSHFRLLGILHIGDEVEIDTGRETYRYRMETSQVVNASAVLDRDSDEPWLTLATCYPLDGLGTNASERLLLSGRLVTP